MAKVTIVTEHDLSNPNGSTVRPKWEYKALKKNGFKDIEIIDNFDQTKAKKISNTLIHAQQLSARLLEGTKYIVDIHGIEHIQSSNLSRGFPVYSWKKYAYKAKSTYYKRIETQMFKNSRHLICSSEDIQEKVKKYQNTTLVRNAVFLDEFNSTNCTELKVALVGPFLPGTLNFNGLPLIKNVIKELPKIQFVFIGKTSKEFKNQLMFDNVKFLGVVNNYAEVLSSCSVLLAPYPEHSVYLGSKNKFLEAAASKMPIITTPSGAVDFRNDLLMIGKDSKKLRELIMSLQDENTRKELGTKLQNEIIEKFNAEVEIKKLIKVYKENMN